MLRTIRRSRTSVAVLAASGLLLLGGTTLPEGGTATAAGDCRPEEFFVSPGGSDRAEGTEDDPWRTPGHARDHIRSEGLNKGMSCDIVVNLRAGDYPVDKAVEFDERDSGSGGHDVIYRSYDGPGKARVVGAEEVTGWEAYKDGIYRADVGKDAFYTLFEDGKRATNARYPNRRTDTEWAPYLISTIPEPEKEAVRRWLWANPGELDPTWDPESLAKATVTIWSGGSWSWFTDTVPIKDVNLAEGQISLEYQTRYAMMNSRSGSRYFLQDSLGFLDQAGEYYLDKEKGQLYYKPRGDIKDAKVLAPTTTQLLDIAGSSERHRVKDITFDGLALQYSDYVEWYRFGWVDDGDSGYEHKYPMYDRQIEMPRNRFGAVTVTNSKDITLTGMHISDTGYHAVYALFANEGLTVKNSLLENIGADGIKVEGPYPGEGNTSNGHVFTNNYITHYGELVPGDAAGVELMDTGDNVVSHSLIEHSARYGVSLEVRPEVPAEDNYARNNTFEYLRIEEAGLDSGDMGAFYTYGVDNAEPHPIDNHVRQVVIGDVIPDGSMPDSGTRGVHMDAGGCGFSFADIEVGEVTDDKYQSYQCNEVENANWQEDFDASRMEYDKIGLKDSFPYPVPDRDAK
ncbi:right-handed parallel beta-helix repeat-containing protein [Streptomyces sp. NBC_01808]|uniref:right-handed parallel beta-helix repeat-containing protein n=1 Tax=Streptomyces sp. NBC_01808 TaxID=2975947 RepID=UPI002DDAE9DD|nr:right-handed parallel beta-helix repeat-containing protein [Streptomyces sp. NBC_01808]WSA36008.1 right-handed parallel beta-helix repeat-containing protein [Streptomyces sp. NBC_01808]